METLNIWEEMHMEEMAEKMEALLPEVHFSAELLLEKLIRGDLYGAFYDIFEMLIDLLSLNLPALRKLMIGLLLIGIVSAFFIQFADLIEKYKVSEIGYYCVYLVVAVILVRCFRYYSAIAGAVLENILYFIKMMMPAYLLAISVATGTVTAAAEGQLLLLLIYGVEEVLRKGFLQVSTFFFIVSIIAGIDLSDRWENLLDQLKKGVETGLKIAVGGVGGLSMLQAILTPAVDGLFGTTMQRIISAIPGLGNSADSVLRIAAGSANVIKNSVGILLMLLLLVVCAMPILKILVVALTLHVTSALLGIIGDQKLSKTVMRAGQAGMLFLGVVFCAVLFFLLSFAATMASVRY